MTHTNCGKCVMNGQCEVQAMRDLLILRLKEDLGIEASVEDVDIALFKAKAPGLPDIVDVVLSEEVMDQMVKSPLLGSFSMIFKNDEPRTRRHGSIFGG